MRDMMLVAVGGSLGALARYGIGLAAAAWLGKGFPWGTLVCNVAGCLVMGLVAQLLLNLESQVGGTIAPDTRTQLAIWHKGVAIGFLGALTTFSTFGADTFREIDGGRPLLAFANVAANVLLSLAAVWAGMALVRAVD